MTDGRFPLSGQAAPGGPPGLVPGGAGSSATATLGAETAAAGGPAGDAPVPAGLRLRPDPGARLVAGGSVLVGGSPVRVLRLTPAGARHVASWFAGTPVTAATAARTLARRLLDAGIAHPDFAHQDQAAPALPHPDNADSDRARADRAAVPPGDAVPPHGPAPADVTVVIPVRDRHAELGRCLAGLRAPGPAASPPGVSPPAASATATASNGYDDGSPTPGDVPPGSVRPGGGGSGAARSAPRVIVVDDASADPAAIAAIAARHGASVIHRPVNGGPGAARNTGLAAAETSLVAFLDSDCVPKPGWLDRLLPHFADPAVGAVAPRIVPHESGTGWLARYEGASSTLDMGARPSIVRPGARVSYVPGAALLVRRSAAGDGFRHGMYVGEDVDFVWRLAAAGWRVRYEPDATMGHDHRVTFRAWFARRADYGTSAAALEELHPGTVRPLYASWWTAGAWAAALSGRPVTAAALTAAATALLARRLSRVTGERWPLPSRAPLPAPATFSTPATMPASSALPAAAALPASAPASAPDSATAPDPDREPDPATASAASTIPATAALPVSTPDPAMVSDAATPGTFSNPAIPSSADNSKKPSGDPGCGVMVDSSPHPNVANYPPSSVASDNSKKSFGVHGLAKTVDVWVHPDVPKRPPSSPASDNSKWPGGERRFGKIVDRWEHSGAPSDPSSSPAPDNSKWRSRSRARPHGLRRGRTGGTRQESAAWELAVRLAGGGTLAAGRPIGSALSRTWWPVAIPAALAVRKLRLPVAVLMLAPPLLDWADRRPPLDPARYVAARLLDDAAYSIGVWQGCIARRTFRPLLPVIGGKAGAPGGGRRAD